MLTFITKKQIVDRQKYAPTDKSYEREFQVLSTLYHENIINLRCTYVTEKNVFMVTEVVHGGELLEGIRELFRGGRETDHRSDFKSGGVFTLEESRPPRHQVGKYFNVRSIAECDGKIN